MADLSTMTTRRERRRAETLAARLAEESKPRIIEEAFPRVIREPLPTPTEESVFDPRVVEVSPFDELMGTPPPAESRNPKKKGRLHKTRAEWQHAMLMELLRVPIMVPIWWGGMQLCDVFWAHR